MRAAAAKTTVVQFLMLPPAEPGCNNKDRKGGGIIDLRLKQGSAAAEDFGLFCRSLFILVGLFGEESGHFYLCEPQLIETGERGGGGFCEM